MFSIIDIPYKIPIKLNSLIAPPYLKKGDKVAIVALASKLNLDDIRPAINLIEENWGVEVIIGESVGAAYFNFAGIDEIRLRDFQKAALFFLDQASPFYSPRFAAIRRRAIRFYRECP